MNKTYDKDKKQKNPYDSNLIRRSLQYTKPFWRYFLVIILLMTIITGLELLNPYLLKITIDDYINGYQKPIYEVSSDTSYEGVVFNNKKYIRQDKLSEEENQVLKGNPIKTILKKEDGYYIVDYTKKDPKEGIVLSKTDYQSFRQVDIDGLTKVALIFFIVMTLTFIFTFLQVYLLNYTGQRIIFNIRQDVFSHIEKLSISYFDKNPLGRLMTRVTNDTEMLNELFTGVLVNLFKDLFVLIGIMIIMLKLNHKLAFISFALIPFVFLFSLVFRNKIRDSFRVGRKKLAIINSTLNENLTGIETIQIFKKEEKIFKQFDEKNTSHLNTLLRQVKLNAIFRPSIEVIESLGLAFLVFYGGQEAISGVIEFGVLYAFIDYLQRFFRPILNLTDYFNEIQSALVSSERIFAILDEEVEVENTKEAIPIKDFQGKIEFKNVWFAYEDENWVLKDINFTINPGEMVAFVGATGAGKSSIINLITRFYDIQKGEILIDGINIKNYDKYELRNHIGVVLQDVFLFTGNIKNNIRLNNKDISDEEIISVAKHVNAHNFIEKLPQGYNTPVMERGATLSSGQKQLLAFARTLAFDPSVLILDEATSNIDTETELLIQDALIKLTEGRTTIAVAHRLSTIQNSDKIIVLNKGIIKEVGNHQELLEQEGIYYDLYTLQYKEDFQS